jgi:hypothetical protein
MNINHIKVQRSLNPKGEVCPCDGQSRIPGWLIDKMEEERRTGGYDVRRSNQCGSCFTVKSSNGTCNCP